MRPRVEFPLLGHDAGLKERCGRPAINPRFLSNVQQGSSTVFHVGSIDVRDGEGLALFRHRFVNEGPKPLIIEVNASNGQVGRRIFWLFHDVHDVPVFVENRHAKGAWVLFLPQL